MLFKVSSNQNIARSSSADAAAPAEALAPREKSGLAAAFSAYANTADATVTAPPAQPSGAEASRQWGSEGRQQVLDKLARIKSEGAPPGTEKALQDLQQGLERLQAKLASGGGCLDLGSNLKHAAAVAQPRG